MCISNEGYLDPTPKGSRDRRPDTMESPGLNAGKWGVEGGAERQRADSLRAQGHKEGTNRGWQGR